MAYVYHVRCCTQDTLGVSKCLHVHLRRGMLLPVTTDEDEPQALSFGEVVAENVRRLRVAKGLSQGTLARILTLAGPPWSKTNVVALERGRQRVTDEELVQLAVALSVPISELYAGAGQVQFGLESIDRRVIHDALAENKTPDVPAGLDVMASFAVDRDVLAIEVAERLDMPLLEVQRLALELFGQSITAEHRKRVGDAEPTDDRSSAIRRGNHTRAITNEISRLYSEGPQ